MQSSESPSTLARSYAAFSASAGFEDVPEVARELIGYAFADVLGVMVAGADERVVEAVFRAAQASKTYADEAAFLIRPGRTSAANVARVLGTAAHALDFDDVALQGHPSAVLVPAILALGQKLGSDGREMVAAYAAGYEIWHDLSIRSPAPLHRFGWHPSSVFGTVAASATAAKLLHLSVQQTTHAIAISTSMAAGLVGNFGSMMKPTQVGKAAENGIEAAELARQGLTGSPDIIERSDGFMSTIFAGRAIEPVSGCGFHEAWGILERRLDFKLYPVCYCAHRSVDAVLQLREQVADNLDAIVGVDVRISSHQDRVLRFPEPKTVGEARFSVEFCVAAALVLGRLNVNDVTEQALSMPAVRRLMGVIRRSTVEEDSGARLPGFAEYDQVTLVLSNGDKLTSVPVEAAAGSGAFPLPKGRLREKFLSAFEGRKDSGKMEALFSRLVDLPGTTARQIVATFNA